MSSQDFVLLVLQMTLMLGCALFLGQLMRRFGQPTVLGEMMGGLLLGPTIFGAIAPSLYQGLFHSAANVTSVRDASVKMGMLFFLFIAGNEVDLSDLKRLGRGALTIGLVGTLVPIAAGVALVYALPRDFWGEAVQAHFFSFALFLGMNLANSANPVIARILMDLGMLRDDIGTMIMTATIVDDLINWTLYALILVDIAPSGGAAVSNLPLNIGLVLLFFIAVLGVGRWVLPRILRHVRAHLSWPTGFIAFTTLLILAAASVAEGLGIHAFLGAFLVGTALSGTKEQYGEAYAVMTNFALAFFAPIYFLSMGLNANFITSFDFVLVLLIIVVAYLSKMGGVLLGAKLGGIPINRSTWAVAVGLNARGATGIILAGVGFENGVIDERIFVAVVVMALVTSILTGPMIKWVLAKPVPSGALMPNEVKS